MLSKRPEDECMCETSERGERLFDRNAIVSAKLAVAQRILEVFGNQDISNIVFRLRSTRREIDAVLDGTILPSCEMLMGIRRITGVSLDWLLTGEGEPFPVRIESPMVDMPSAGIAYYPPLTSEMPMIRAV